MMPFLLIAIVLPGDTEHGQEEKDVQARIQPQEIESYNPAYHWGTLIKFKSGEILMTRLTVEQVEEILTKYWQKFNEAMQKQKQGSALLLQ